MHDDGARLTRHLWVLPTMLEDQKPAKNQPDTTSAGVTFRSGVIVTGVAYIAYKIERARSAGPVCSFLTQLTFS